jgi:D-alanyl-D-alanine carboxypeptidase (penicillin-binding protein 5/6)
VTNTNALLGHDGFVGMKTGSDEAAGGCLMFRAVWSTGSGSRSLIGVVLGQRGDNLINAGLSAAKQLADRLERRPSASQPVLPAPAGPYGRHIENRIRAGNTPLP